MTKPINHIDKYQKKCCLYRQREKLNDKQELELQKQLRKENAGQAKQISESQKMKL